MRSFILVGTLVIELLDFEVNVSQLHLQAVLLLLDIQVEPQQSLEVGNLHFELSEELSNSNLDFQDLVDISIEVDVVVAVINIEDLIEVEAKIRKSLRLIEGVELLTQDASDVALSNREGLNIES